MKLNQDENRVVNWSIVRGNDIHFGRTTAILLGSVQQLRFIELHSLYPIIIVDHVIPLVLTVKDLGTTIYIVVYNAQVSEVLPRLHGVLYKLGKRGAFLPFPGKSF